MGSYVVVVFKSAVHANEHWCQLEPSYLNIHISFLDQQGLLFCIFYLSWCKSMTWRCTACCSAHRCEC